MKYYLAIDIPKCCPICGAKEYFPSPRADRSREDVLSELLKLAYKGWQWRKHKAKWWNPFESSYYETNCMDCWWSEAFTDAYWAEEVCGVNDSFTGGFYEMPLNWETINGEHTK
jgi:hypothetical protein